LAIGLSSGPWGVDVLALIPYLGTVINLPWWVFRRAYALFFLEQFGPDWQTITASSKPSVPPMWELDLSGPEAS
jgi:hypothetical protein